MKHLEAIASAITSSIANHPNSIEDYVNACEDKEDRIYDLAECIVEPILSPEQQEAYDGFLAEKPEQWAQWIRTTFGQHWGEIADYVNTEGY